MIHLFTPYKLLPPRRDRLTRLDQEFEMAKQMAVDLKEEHATNYFPTYQWTSYLRYFGVPAQQLYPPGRQSQFTLEPSEPCDHDRVTYLADILDAAQASTRFQCFRHKELVRVYHLKVRGETVDSYNLIRYTK